MEDNTEKLADLSETQASENQEFSEVSPELARFSSEIKRGET
jgi:hypothetical protein